jgi:16S rRNA (adenine1518-N6/adenine1519-N6)-dimethyltransferase
MDDSAMTSPRTLLKAWNIYPKKHLGQHFLAQRETAEAIVARAKLTSEDRVIEIGAGVGALTIPLAQRCQRIWAVEKDPQLLSLLKAEVLKYDLTNVDVIQADILKLDWSQWAPQKSPGLVLAGNLPYNISSPILIKMLAHRSMFRCALFMLQKELAQRIAAVPGTKAYGRLSVMFGYCAQVKRLMTIGANQFFPRPQVDSEIILVDFKSATAQATTDEAFLAKVVKAGFGRRRKTLKNALSRSDLRLSASAADALLRATAIDPMRRAETLSVEEFVRLSNTLLDYMGAD